MPLVGFGSTVGRGGGGGAGDKGPAGGDLRPAGGGSKDSEKGQVDGATMGRKGTRAGNKTFFDRNDIAMSTTYDDKTPPAAAVMRHREEADAHRDVLAAVQQALAANWTSDLPRVAVIERNGMATVYVSTTHALGPAVRLDVRGAVRAALAPYTRLAPYTNTVFLRRVAP